LSEKYYLRNRQIACCYIMRFQLRIAHNSVSTKTGVQLQHSLWGSISTSRISVKIYDAMIFTDRHRICWIFEVVLSYTCFILKHYSFELIKNDVPRTMLSFQNIIKTLKYKQYFVNTAQNVKFKTLVHPYISGRPNRSEMVFHNVDGKCFQFL
jgi:hypothetical protein